MNLDDLDDDQTGPSGALVWSCVTALGYLIAGSLAFLACRG
jgi:hypothetical protein